MEREEKLTFDAVRISTKAMNDFSRDNFGSELVLISPPGSSGARVSIFKSSDEKSLYAVKCARSTRISLSDEVERKEILTQYIPEHLPKILWVGKVEGFEAIISECSGLQTLHNLIMGSEMPHDKLLSIWNDVVVSLVTMWGNSKTFPFRKDLCPRVFSERIKRIRKGLCQRSISGVPLSGILHKKVRINGQDYPSIDYSLENISKIKNPQFGVTCHGDPQPSNIIVGRSDPAWYCVDWEWSGPNQDWRMMASHLYGWWFTRCMVLKTEPKIRVSREKVYFEYESFLPDHLQDYPRKTLTVLNHIFGENLNGDAKQDINRYLATLYFGDVRFLGIWNREVFAIPLLSQGIIAANEVGMNLSRDDLSFSI